MIQEQVIPINFSQGVDTKTDPKSVVAGKFLRLENGVFTNVNRISKRNGYTAAGTAIASFGTMSDPKMAHSFNNELIAADQNQLISYSSNQDAWISKGAYTSTELQSNLISDFQNISGACDVAILGNYALYGWVTLPAQSGSSFPAGTLAKAYGQVVDLSTGNILLTQEICPNSGNVIKCVVLGNSTLCITYFKNTVEMGARTVVFSGSGVVSFSAETIITTNFIFGNPFDIVPTSTGAAFIYTSSTGITTATLSTSLVVNSINRVVTVGFSVVVAIGTTSNGNIWSYWTESTDDSAGNLTALTIYYAVYSSVLVQVLNRTSIVATASPFYVSNMVTKSDSATQQTLYYGIFTTNNSSAKQLEKSNYVTITSAGVVGTPTLFANGVIPFSHPFTVGSRIYGVYLYRGGSVTVSIGSGWGPQTQPTIFVLELTNLISPPQVVARFGYGISATFTTQPIVFSLKPNVASFSSTKFYFACGLVTQTATGDSLISGYFPNGIVSIFSYSFDFDSVNSNKATTAGDLVLLNGGLIQNYDGSSCNEWNFHLAPEITNIAETGTGGHIADGTYSYIAIRQWVDARGNLHQSAPSLPIATSAAAGTGTSKLTITITANFLTQKSNSWVNIYRTAASGTVYHLVSDPIFVVFDDPSSVAIVTFSDTLADATIANNSLPYTDPASSVLENTTPPPSMIILAHNNRAFFVDSENRNTLWYTKSFSPGTGLSPSGFMTEQIDPKFGNISALAEMDEKLVVLKDFGLCIVSGDGVNDTGNGNTFSFPQFVPSDVGCDQLKSVVGTPEGVMFHSPNGIYLLDRKTNVGYIGMEVEAYNAQSITAATPVKGKSQIRFLCSTGVTLVYDYIFKQWSTFTNHTGNSATIWNGVYAYATTNGKIYKESSSSYLDDATSFKLLAQTSWLALASIQGFQRVRRLIMLGDFVNGNSALHALSISAAYDFSTTFQSAISFAFGAVSASGVFQYRERLPIQKCDSISLLIQETTTGSSAEYIDLTNISFEAGVKKGVNKLGGQYSVG